MGLDWCEHTNQLDSQPDVLIESFMDSFCDDNAYRWMAEIYGRKNPSTTAGNSRKD